MDPNKVLLVPINYGGKWEKVKGCWIYEGLDTRYVRVRQSTTYVELIEDICAEIGISKDDTIVHIKGWMSFPVQNKLLAFSLVKNLDIITFIDLNRDKDCTTPLCITTTPKPKVMEAPSQQVVMEELKIEAENLMVAEKPLSKSVNKPFIVPPRVQDNQDTFGLDETKLTNPLDNTGGGGEAVFEKSEHDVEEEDSNDLFDNDDPFNNAYDDDSYEMQDPFDCVYDGFFDPYSGVCVESHPEEEHEYYSKDGNTENTKNVDENGVSAASIPLPNEPLNSPISKGNRQSEAQSTNINVHVLKDFKVGELVQGKEELLLRLRVLTVKANREFRVTHSNRSRLIVTCIEKSCGWRLRATVAKKHGNWVIRSYVNDHNCSIDARFKRNRGAATSGVIAQMVKDDTIAPGDIVKMLEKVYGIKITYWKAWKAKEIATQLIRGNPEASFMGLPSYLWLLENANQGTYSAYQLDMNNSFVQCFLSFGPSISGFRSSIRPVIAVDACFLKGRYNGRLFIACCMDGNNQIYPLVFGVGATENDVTWSWFFQQLRHVIGSRDGFVFISDRHPSIEKCCMEQFPDAVYGICMFHLGLNMNARYKVKATEFLYSVAKVYTEIVWPKFISKNGYSKNWRPVIRAQIQQAQMYRNVRKC